ncbi:MAG: hypothetical protein EOP49_02500, partial [Sphingobacteriales bacterium]
ANSFIASFLHDTTFQAIYNGNGSFFNITLGGDTVVEVANVTFPTGIYKFTAVHIEGTVITLSYLDSNLILHEVSSTITGLHGALDFNCECKEFVPVDEVVNANFVALLNHLWWKKSTPAGVPDPYLPQQLLPLQPFITGESLSQVNHFEQHVGSGPQSSLGMQFNFMSAGAAGLQLPLMLLPGTGSPTSDYYQKITHFSNFRIIGSASPIYTFSVFVHYASYHTYDSSGQVLETFPAGIAVAQGTINGLKLSECLLAVTAGNQLSQLFSGIVNTYNGSSPHTANGYTAGLGSLPLTLAPNLPRVVANFNAAQTTAGSSFVFNLSPASACQVAVDVPGVSLSNVSSFSNLVFTDSSFTAFSVVVSTGQGPVTATGSIGCLKIDDCRAEVAVPCATCIPPQVPPINCTQKWIEFRAGMHNQMPGYTVPEYYIDPKMFCDSNYGFISSEYLYYLSVFNITSTDDANFINLGEFSATPLNSGYAGMISTIDSYKTYLSNPLNVSYTWQEYVQNVYMVVNDVCPPLPMMSNVTVDTSQVKTPCEIFTEAINASYTAVFTEQYYENKRQDFIKKYISQAIDNAVEEFTKTAPDKEYQYTLYYYDQAGNLIKTVPPEGVTRMALDQAGETHVNNTRATNPDCETAADAGFTVAPTHTLETQYQYNSLNQLVWQKTPDGGITRFAYDDLGRIIASQNDKQHIGDPTVNAMPFSYTRYDGLGRIYEAGEILIPLSGAPYSINDNGRLILLGEPQNGFEDDGLNVFNKREVTRTTYDYMPQDLPLNLDAASLFSGTYSGENSQKRVTGILYYNNLAPGTSLMSYDNAIFYDYDVHGNVKQLVHHNRDLVLATVGSGAAKQDVKRIVYDYDLISGNVNRVTYQPADPNSTAENDQFIHKYAYDADNRITDVYTSTDDVIWEKDAHYEYYLHGPLARVELGDKKVQGLDYLYTLQGWLKGVNSEQLGPEHDPAADGTAAAQVGQDAIGFALNYYRGDYTSRHNTGVSANTSLFGFTKGQNMEGTFDLFNGNIKEMVTSMLALNQLPSQAAQNINVNTQFNQYRYDQLNRIRQMDSKGISYANPLAPAAPADSYKSNYTYDNNGNLKFLNRWGVDVNGVLVAGEMDKLGYAYPLNSDGKIVSNRLASVAESSPNPGTFDGDIDVDHNYTYDAIGQLTSDLAENITDIQWRVDGKVRSVTKGAQQISFEYDGLGNRIAKKVTEAGTTTTTFYEHDAQGNVLSTYRMVKPSSGPAQYFLVEQDIYGSSRLGIQEKLLALPASTSPLRPGAPSADRLAESPQESAPPPPADRRGIKINDGGVASWSDPDNQINLFNNNSKPQTETIAIDSHFKIDPGQAFTGAKTLAGLHGGFIDGRYPYNGSHTYMSSVMITVIKDAATGKYKPVIELIRYWRNHHGRYSDHGKKRFSYRNYMLKTTYNIAEAIPEDEWDFHAVITQNNDSFYDVVLTINGNVYTTTSNTPTSPFEPDNESNGLRRARPELIPPFVDNALGETKILYMAGRPQYYPAVYPALASEICDFTYSVDILKNNFDLDQFGTYVQPVTLATLPSSISVTTNLEDDQEEEPSLTIKLNASALVSSTYCGGNTDDDLDGISNEHDNCPFVFNPNQLDDDLDNIGNACDNCVSTFNPDQKDDDGDGRGDLCDNCVSKSNYSQMDDDGDHVGNACDNCVSFANPGQEDADHDGIGDICEGLDQGLATTDVELAPYECYRFVGDKKYELTNHLGNVLSVITDRLLFRKVYLGGGTRFTYMPDVISYNDYYPFGMLVPNRHESSAVYRYGFQGQEKDDEVKGEGNSLNYTYRMHDPRVGRFFATDPLEDRYPFMTPYQFASNSPVGAIEIEGLEGSAERGFNAYMTSKGGVQALAVKTDKENGRAGAEAIFVRMPEATIDGITYASTSLFQAMIGGFTYGYGDITYGNGYKTKVDIPSIGFNWTKGFHVDSKSATTGNLSFKDGMRVLDGVTTMFAIGELNAVRGIVGERIKLSEKFYKAVGGKIEQISGINPYKAVSKVELTQERALYQWSIDGKLGDYFTTSPNNRKLGLPVMADGTPAYRDIATGQLKPRTLVKVELSDGTKVEGLKSTAGDVKAWDGPGTNLGGDPQIFAPGIKTTNPTVTPVN